MKTKTILIFSLVSVLILGVVSIASAGSGGSIHGGGQLREKHGSQLYKISFGGWLQDGDELVGEWEVNFHNVGVDDLDQSKFQAKKFLVVNFYTGNNASCHSAFNFTAEGKWNKLPGYTMTFRSGDNGSPGKDDTVRVTLSDPDGNEIYDTHWNTEFEDESNCVGTARTGLDKGNLTIVRP